MKELLNLKVRWFDIRGFGDKQRDQKFETYSKIVAYLRISPFTFEQLQKVSSIHRNTLSKRLNELINQKVILKHKYLDNIDLVTIKKKIYEKLPIPIKSYSNFPPMFKRNYYILNYEYITNYEECKHLEFDIKYIECIIQNTIKARKNSTNKDTKYSNLIQRYYSNNRTNQNEELDTVIYKKLKTLDDQFKKLSVKKSDDIKKGLKFYHIIIQRAFLREMELIAVKERVFLNLLLPLDESGEFLDMLENCIDYFSKQGMTNADILIKCSTENTSLNIANTFKFLPMIDYEDLLCYFFNTARKLP